MGRFSWDAKEVLNITKILAGLATVKLPALPRGASVAKASEEDVEPSKKYQGLYLL